MDSPIVHQPHEKPDRVCVRMQDVDSTSIRRIGYNADTQQLVVHFYDSLPDLRTVYWPVPNDLYRELLAAESMGRFLQEHIRYTYDFSLVREQSLVDPDQTQRAAYA